MKFICIAVIAGLVGNAAGMQMEESQGELIVSQFKSREPGEGLLVSTCTNPLDIVEFNKLDGNMIDGDFETQMRELRDMEHHTLWSTYIRSDLPVKCFTGRYWGMLYDPKKVADYIGVNRAGELDIHTGDQQSGHISAKDQCAAETEIGRDTVLAAMNTMADKFKRLGEKNSQQWKKWNEIRSYLPGRDAIIGLVRVAQGNKPIANLEQAKADFACRANNFDEGEAGWNTMKRKYPDLPVFTYWVEYPPTGKNLKRRRRQRINEGTAAHLECLGTLAESDDETSES